MIPVITAVIMCASAAIINVCSILAHSNRITAEDIFTRCKKIHRHFSVV